MNSYLLTPHFCETMYIHYDLLIMLCKDPAVKEFIQGAQDYYLEMHSRLVPLADLVQGGDRGFGLARLDLRDEGSRDVQGPGELAQ